MTMEPALSGPESHCIPVFVARQAIFDASLRLFGYELLFRGCDHGPAVVENPSCATASVIANGLSLLAPQLQSHPVFINFPEELLVEGAPLSLRPETCVIEILENVTPTKELLRALKHYKDQGYVLALDDYVGQPELKSLLDIADIVKVDVRQRSPSDIIKLCQKLRAPGRTLLAEKIDNRMTFEVAASLDIAYFQGYYFSKPVIEKGATLRTTTVTRLRMLGELSSKDYSVSQIARVISQDPGLSFRLLKHINSPYFGFQGRVSSLAQAVTLMGAIPLKQWLMLVLLADMGEGGRHEDLVFTAVCRASFLERLALIKPLPAYGPETLFMVGLLSNLDALLHQGMEEIVSYLPLDTAVVDALLGEKNEVRRYLDLRIYLETAHWEKAEQLMAELSLHRGEVAGLLAEASSWTLMMLQFDREVSESSQRSFA